MPSPAGTISRTRQMSKRLLRAVVPLSVRQEIAKAIQQHHWITPLRRQWWSMELVRDLADRDIDAFHRFLWSNHLGYAESYEAACRFGSDNMKLSRRMFFADLREHVATVGLSPEDIRSVFEVGCSLGYQLRSIETDLFTNATELVGIDIDRHAIRCGTDYLRVAGSKVVLCCADLSDLARVLAGKTYDLIICTGVLMYLNEDRAAEAVATMLRHAKLTAMTGLAHPTVNNAQLPQSDVRSRDRAFIHNMDRMVDRAEGRVLARRWEGSRDADGNTIYFVFATAT